MERIQKALKSAKQQREQQEAIQKPKKGVSGKAKIPEDIQYSQTQQLSTSDVDLKSNRIVAGLEGHPNADVFRVLRTMLLHRMRKEGWNTLAVTSPLKGAGKTLIASNLAIAMAMEKNQTVMLVDLDLRRPSIHKYFGFEAAMGLSDILLDDADLPDLLIHPGIERLVILPAGRSVSQSSELLSTPRMQDLVEDITNRYSSRMIIFDLPPLLGLDDALAFLPNVHSSMLVVEEGGNTREEVQQSLFLLENTNFLGTVYNKARSSKQAAYYY